MELSLNVNNIDSVLCRLVYSLACKVSKEELLYLELYNRSNGGIYDRGSDLALMKELGMTKQLYWNGIRSLEKKGLLSKGDGVLILSINLRKRNINKLIINKRHENK